MELGAVEEGEGQVEAEDEEGEEDSGREAGSCTRRVRAMHPPTQVALAQCCVHMLINVFLNVAELCCSLS